MQITITDRNRIPEIKVSGEIDHYYAPKFENVLTEVINKNPNRSIAVDLSEVRYLDSGAIGVLFATSAILKKRSPQKQIILICPNKNIKKIIKLVGITENSVFLVVDQWEEKVIKETA